MNNIGTNYKFSYSRMLNDKGNTNVYIQYMHARISSVIRNSGEDMEEVKKVGEVSLDHGDERALGLHLLKFAEVVDEVCANMLPSKLCDYLYGLSECFSRFYKNCMVMGSEEETSRLLLCHATAIVTRKCLSLLGITPVFKL